MKKIVFTTIRCVICIMLCSTLISCSIPTPTEPAANVGDEHANNLGNYLPQAGDRVRLTGIFRTSKGYVGGLGEVLIPHFYNREEEGLKYRGKWVNVTGTLFAPSYPEDKDAQGVTLAQGVRKVQAVREVQGLRGLHLKLESIEIVTDEGMKHEKAEKLESVQ